MEEMPDFESTESAESVESRAEKALTRARECLDAGTPETLAEGISVMKRMGDEIKSSGDARHAALYREMCNIYNRGIDAVDVGTEEEKTARWEAAIQNLILIQDDPSLAVYFLNGLRHRANHLGNTEKLEQYTKQVQELGGALEVIEQKSAEAVSVEENPYLKDHSPEIAEYLWNLDRTMRPVIDGSASADELDEIAHDFLVQDLDRAESEAEKPGMDDVIRKIKEAIEQTEARLASLQ